MSEPPLHIAHLLLTDRFAGSERYAIELANLQSQRGHRVSMVLPASAAEPRPDALRHRLAPAVEVHLVPGWRLLRARRAAAIVRRLAPDIAHAHLSQACKALALLGAGTTRRVATLHIRYKPQQHAALDGLIAIAPWQLGDVPPAQQPHCVQIDNWAPAVAFDADARDRLRSSLGLAPDTWLVGTLGRVEASKAHPVLVEAWRRAGLPHARLAIVGSGRDWKRVRAAAPPEVLMPGFADRPQDWMSAFDLFVSAAASEPFGLVFLEAMRCGLPILASDSEGAAHLQPWIGRPLWPRGDAGALAQALSQLAAERPARRAYDLSAFEPAPQADRIEAFYRRLRGAAHQPKATHA
jgi:glycosyltransferase involved in cell wall biosynthesis